MEGIGQTICGHNAMISLETLARSVQSIEGDVAEVGVYKGGSAVLLKRTLPEDNIYLFDTFEGIPSAGDFDNLHKAGDFSDTSFEQVSAVFADFFNVFVYKGCFPEHNSEVIADKKFKLVHLDVDTYQSHIDCLNFFHDKMVPSGVIVFDDYAAPTCLGARKAIDEFAAEKGMEIHPGGDYQAYFVY
jgi:O-methyltransferase